MKKMTMAELKASGLIDNFFFTNSEFWLYNNETETFEGVTENDFNADTTIVNEIIPDGLSFIFYLGLT